jgi:hypothetical protein
MSNETIIGGCAGTEFGCCPDGSTSKVDQQGSNCPKRPVQKYDQVVKGDISIKQKGKNKYKIVFNQISDFLVYQVWSDKTPNSNNHRNVYNLKASDWVRVAFPSPPGNPPFQPTTVMELDLSSRFVFVITNAKVKHKKVVFTVSVKEIDLVNKTTPLTQIPVGSFRNVRFDIDSAFGVADTDPGAQTCCNFFNTNFLTFPDGSPVPCISGFECTYQCFSTSSIGTPSPWCFQPST